MSKTKTLYMETTSIDAPRTAAEISSCLIQAGATQIATDYDKGKITGLRWTMRIGVQEFMFSMPARVEPVYKLLLSRRKTYVSTTDKINIQAQAERVAWRQLLRWVQAQLAMIDVGMVQAREVFLPYMHEPNSGRTVFELFEGNTFKALPAPETKQ